MTTTNRRRCDNPACGKQYRPKTARSQYCRPKCRQAVYVARQAEKARARAELQRAYAKIIADAEARRAVSETPAPEPEPVPEPAPRAAPSRRLPEPPPIRITITQPTTFPGTPLPRGYR